MVRDSRCYVKGRLGGLVGGGEKRGVVGEVKKMFFLEPVKKWRKNKE